MASPPPLLPREAWDLHGLLDLGKAVPPGPGFPLCTWERGRGGSAFQEDRVGRGQPREPKASREEVGLKNQGVKRGSHSSPGLAVGLFPRS